MPTKIEWAEETWNPVTGCTKVSPGCKHCYAETQAERFRGTKAFPNGFDLTLKPERLEQPQRWKKPRRIFVNSMSDLFHEGIDDQYIILTYEIMRSTTRHEYLVLTKRAERMREMLTSGLGVYMHPNIWHGVSVENQDYALRRIPDLCDVPSPVRFLSCEPLLGPLDLTPWLDELQWVIVGGESGPRQAADRPRLGPRDPRSVRRRRRALLHEAGRQGPTDPRRPHDPPGSRSRTRGSLTSAAGAMRGAAKRRSEVLGVVRGGKSR